MTGPSHQSLSLTAERDHQLVNKKADPINILLHNQLLGWL